MKSKKILSILLILASFLLSQIIIFKFTLHEGFQYLGYDLKIRPILNYAHSSPRSYITSISVGYLLSAIFLLINFNQGWVIRKKLTFSAVGICFLALSVELTTLWESWHGVYHGSHFEVGIPLVILNLLLYRELFFKR